MTSAAFIFGVIPLAFGSGPGSELRQALGVAVFFGMLGVTVFGLVFTPLFYVLCRKLAARFSRGHVPRVRFVDPGRPGSAPPSAPGPSPGDRPSPCVSWHGAVPRWAAARYSTQAEHRDPAAEAKRIEQ